MRFTQNTRGRATIEKGVRYLEALFDCLDEYISRIRCICDAHVGERFTQLDASDHGRFQQMLFTTWRLSYCFFHRVDELLLLQVALRNLRARVRSGDLLEDSLETQ